MPEGMTTEQIVEAVREETKGVYEKLDRKTSDMAEVIEGLQTKSADVDTLKGHLEDIKSDVQKLAEQADELDMKMSRPGASGPDGSVQSTPGQLVCKSDAYDKWKTRGAGTSERIQLKAITNLGNTVSGQSENVLVEPTRAPFVEPTEQPLMVRDLLPVGRTASDTVKYAREASFTNAAAPVAEGALKPESNLTFSQETANVITIAHWIPASKQVLADAPMLQSYIDGRMTYGLKLKEEQQIMLGDGTGENMDGLVPNASAFVSTGIPHGTNSNSADVLRWAKLQVRKSFYPASAIVMNPEDWAKLELLKDADGNYLYAAFTSGTTPRLWGMRVAESDTIPVGQFMVGSFNLAAEIWDREDAGVELSTEDRDNFVKNMVTIRAEERLALAIYRTDAFVHGSLTVT